MKAVIYARVSSTVERQSTERQILDLTAYADKNSIEVVKTFEEHISGAKKNRDRFILNECLAYAVDNGIDIILISELSRLGRNVDEVLANIRFCKDNHLNIYFQKEGFTIYDKDNKENPFATIMCAVLGTCAQLERDAIYFRLSSGRKVYVAKHLKETGIEKGRAQGADEERKAYTKALLAAGVSAETIASALGMSVEEVRRLV